MKKKKKKPNSDSISTLIRSNGKRLRSTKIRFTTIRSGNVTTRFTSSSLILFFFARNKKRIIDQLEH